MDRDKCKRLEKILEDTEFDVLYCKEWGVGNVDSLLIEDFDEAYEIWIKDTDYECERESPRLKSWDESEQLI